MGNTELERVSSVEYLGVLIDENLNWSNQIKSLCLKISRSAGIISKWRYYVDSSTLIAIYFSIVQSYLQYSRSALQPLEIIQNIILI